MVKAIFMVELKNLVLKKEQVLENLVVALKKKSYSLRRAFVDSFLITESKAIGHGATVLDLGGLKEGKRGYYSSVNYFKKVIHANICLDRQPEVCCDICTLPFTEESFDYILCSEVLEHVFEVDQAVSEISRILRKNGIVFLTVPFFYRIHGDPSDYGRFTHHYWKEVLERKGMRIEKIEAQGNLWTSLMDMTKHYFHIRYEGKKKPFLDWILWKLQIRALGSLSDSQSYFYDYPSGYGIVARKMI